MHYFYDTLYSKEEVWRTWRAQPPTKDGAWEIIRTKNNKSLTEDNISAELIKYGDKKLWEEIHALFEVIRASEKMPENWRTAIIRPYIRREIKCNVAFVKESLY